VAVPSDRAEASPSRPAPFDTGATEASELDQVTCVVRSWFVESEKTPVAANCSVVPRAIDGVAGVTWIEASVAPVTVRSVDPVTALKAAVIVTLPVAKADASPLLPGLFETVATVSSEEVQVT